MRAEYGPDDHRAVSSDRDSSPESADLVGRERERAALRGAYERARAGQGGLVLISGEAGIGKTSLVQALLTEVDEHEAIVLTGASYDLSTTPPYGPCNELARAYRASPGLPMIPDFMAGSKTQSGPSSQAELFSRALEFFVEVANHQTLVMVLEDLHWSDQSSLELLRFVARNIHSRRILLIVTFRDDEVTRKHSLYLMLPNLVRESSAERITLRRLSSSDIRDYAAQNYPITDPDLDKLTSYLDSRSDGNPLFIQELLRTLELDCILQVQDRTGTLGDLSQASVPNLIHQMVERRMLALSDSTCSALQTASVIGQSVSVELWERLTGADTVAAAAEEALESQFVTEIPGGLNIAFRHALVREAVYESLTLPHRRRFHQQIADILIDHSDPNADSIADHLQQAGDPRAAEWLILAGEDAERQFAWREAFIRYNRALDTLRRERGSDRQIAGLMLKTARLLRYFDPERGNRHLEAARRSALDCGDHAVAALALFNIGNNLCNLGHGRRGLRVMRDAIEALAIEMQDETPDEVARLIRWSGTATGVPVHPLMRINGTLAPLLTAFGRYHEAVLTAERYLEVDWRTATTENQYSSIVRATKFNLDGYKGIGMALSALGRPEEAKLAFNLAQEILQLRYYLPYRLLVASMELILLHFPFRATNIQERAELVELIEEAVQPSSGMTDAGNSLWGYEYYLFLHGRWNELRVAAQANDLPTDFYYRSVCLGVRASLARAEGNTDRAWELVNVVFPNGVATEFDEQVHSVATETQRLAATMAREAGDYHQARQWMSAHDCWLNWNDTVRGRPDGSLIWAQIHYSEGDTKTAVEIARKALEQAGAPEQPLALLKVHRFLGELAIVSEDFDSAESHLRASIDLAEACQIPFERALSLLALAELRTARGDQQVALTLLNDVRGVCAELDAQPTLDRVDRLAASLSRSHGESPYGLTAREIEVLAFVVQGHTDRQIAERLFISHRTVMRHVTHILRKLDVESRTAAAARAVGEDLL